MIFDVSSIFYLLIFSLILVYFLQEILNKDNPIILRYLLFGILIVVLICLIYIYYVNKREEDQIQEDASCLDDVFPLEVDDPDNDKPDKGGSTVIDLSSNDFEEEPMKIRMNAFAVAESNEINYIKFKQLYLSPAFIAKYTQAMKDSCKIYKKRILEVRKQFQSEFAQIKPKDEGIPISQLLNSNDESKTLETTINELGKLYREIIEREKLINENYCKKSLITALTDSKKGLDSLHGRVSIKDFIAQRLYAFCHNPSTFINAFNNTAILGGPGLGKTKIATVIAFVYAKSMIILRDHIHITTPQNFANAFVNESARLTRKLLLNTLGSAVFIDEVYELGSDKSLIYRGINHGDESITEIVNFCDKLKGLSLIIVAGYEEVTQTRFFGSNAGLPRRFPYQIVLNNYSAKELSAIAIQFLMNTCNEITLKKSDVNFIYTLINYINEREPEIFEAQAGAIENLMNSVSRSIYVNVSKTFEKDSQELILNGFNNYLQKYNISIQLDNLT